MKLNHSLKDLLKKDAAKISRTMGIIYSLFGTGALLMVLLQKQIMKIPENQPSEPFDTTMNLLHTIWTNYMPFLIAIGICYFILGKRFNSIKERRATYNIVLSMISLLWAIGYSVSSIEYIKSFTSMSPEILPGFDLFTILASIVGFIMVIGIMTVPQFHIHKKIKVENQENYNTP